MRSSKREPEGYTSLRPSGGSAPPNASVGHQRARDPEESTKPDPLPRRAVASRVATDATAIVPFDHENKRSLGNKGSRGRVGSKMRRGPPAGVDASVARKSARDPSCCWELVRTDFRDDARPDNQPDASELGLDVRRIHISGESSVVSSMTMSCASTSIHAPTRRTAPHTALETLSESVSATETASSSNSSYSSKTSYSSYSSYASSASSTSSISNPTFLSASTRASTKASTKASTAVSTFETSSSNNSPTSYVSSHTSTHTSFHTSSDTSSNTSSNTSFKTPTRQQKEACCSRHPQIQLKKLRSNGDWTVLRKKCPLCSKQRSSKLSPDNTLQDDSSTTNDSTVSDPSSSSSSTVTTNTATSQTPDELAHLHCRLAARAYHFSGNTWFEDWVQYMSNTHTVLGLFFHHPLHPIVLKDRLLILLGSISIGLTLSNLPKTASNIWTFGGFVHNLFDLGMWHIRACMIYRCGGLINDKTALYARIIISVIIFIFAVVAMSLVSKRASAQTLTTVVQHEEYGVYEVSFQEQKSYTFLLGNIVDFMFDIFVYYPLTVTVLFSGILSLGGRIPILGGRSREMSSEKECGKNVETSSVRKSVVDDQTVANSSSEYDDTFDHFDQSQIL